MTPEEVLGRAMRITELEGHIQMLKMLHIQAYPGGEAEKEIDRQIADKRAEIERLTAELLSAAATSKKP